MEKIDAKWLDFSHLLNRRALIGLAMVYQAKENFAGAKFCYAQAKMQNQNEALVVSEFNGLAFSRHWKEALKYCEELDKTGPGFAERTKFWPAVANAGIVADAHDGSTNTSPIALKLQRTGIIGMLRQFDVEAVQNFIERHSIVLRDNVTEDLWIRSSLKYLDRKHKPNEPNEIDSLLTKAIAIAGNDFSPTDLSHIKYLQGLTKLQQNEPSAAIECVQDSTAFPISSELKHRISWLTCRAQIELAKTNKRRVAVAIAEIEKLLSTFPGSNFAPQAQFEKLKLENSLGSITEAIQNINSIKPNHKFYEAAQLELVRQQHRLWKSFAKPEHTAQKSSSFQKLLEINSNIQKSSFKSEKKIISTLLVVDACLHENKPDIDIATLLQKTEDLLESLPERNDELYSQLMYYRFMASQRNEDMGEASEIANWLVNNSKNVQQNIQALVFLANQLEQQSATPAQLIPLYERLTELLGTTADALAKSRNGRAASNRLIEMYIQTRLWGKALVLNQNLLATNPNQLIYVIHSARIATGMKQPETAISNWRRIARTCKPGSEHWLEAKHGIVLCLKTQNPQLAKEVLVQTISLAGEMKEPWKTKYTTLLNYILSEQNSEMPNF